MPLLAAILALALLSLMRSASYFRKHVQDEQKRRRSARQAFAELAARRKRHASIPDRRPAVSAFSGTLPGSMGDESPESSWREETGQSTIAPKERTLTASEIGSQARQLVNEFLSNGRTRVFSTFAESDRHKDEQLDRLDRIAALGAAAIPALERAILAIVSGSAYQIGVERAAGMLGETIGRIGGPSAFAALERIVSVRTNMGEYHRDIKPGAIRGLAYLAGADERAKRIVTEFALEEGYGLALNPILKRVGVEPVSSSDVLADEFLRAYGEKRQSLLDYVRSLASRDQQVKTAALYRASRGLQDIGEKQAALLGYLALLHVDPIRAGAVDGVCNLLDLEKDHPLQAPLTELHRAAFSSPSGPTTLRHKEIVRLIKEQVLKSAPGAEEICDAVTSSQEKSQ